MGAGVVRAHEDWRGQSLLAWSFVKNFAVLNIQGQKKVAVSVIIVTPSLLGRRVGGGRHCRALGKSCRPKEWLVFLSAQRTKSDDDDNLPPQMRLHNFKERSVVPAASKEGPTDLLLKGASKGSRKSRRTVEGAYIRLFPT